MDIVARLRASALVEALTADGDSFPADAARELVGLVPVSRRRASPLRMVVAAKGPGSAIEGAAAGGGTASLAQDDEVRRWSLGEPVAWRCGLYKIEHERGRMMLSQLWADTHEDETGRACLLLYGARDGRLRRLDLQVEHAIGLGPVRFAFRRFERWKRPA